MVIFHFDYSFDFLIILSEARLDTLILSSRVTEEKMGCKTKIKMEVIGRESSKAVLRNSYIAVVYSFLLII